MTASFNNLHNYSTITCQCSLLDLQPLTVAYVSCLKSAILSFKTIISQEILVLTCFED